MATAAIGGAGCRYMCGFILVLKFHEAEFFLAAAQSSFLLICALRGSFLCAWR